jgi:5'-3' exonuclease
MGIKYLNKLLLNSCNQESIRSGVSLSEFTGKILVIDASIYIYKFLEEKALIENMYLFVSIMIHHKIIPLFVFDGKSPPEKKDLLYERRMKKREAERCYMELKSSLDPMTKDTEQKMESLRRQFIRMTDENIRATKELLTAYGITYYEAMGEADELCVQLVLQNKAWACVSDDMDMFVYGCPRVIRNISLLNQTCILYDLNNILTNLNMTMTEFRQIMVLSGTDYNINDTTCLNETMNWFHEYKKQRSKGIIDDTDFYHWLCKNTKYITNMEFLERVYKMFILEDLSQDFANNIHILEKNDNALNSLLQKEGFLK